MTTLADTDSGTSEPDWAKLKELYQELDRLQKAKRFDKAAFSRLYDEMLKAADGDEEFLGGLIAEADPSW